MVQKMKGKQTNSSVGWVSELLPGPPNNNTSDWSRILSWIFPVPNQVPSTTVLIGLKIMTLRWCYMANMNLCADKPKPVILSMKSTRAALMTCPGASRMVVHHPRLWVHCSVTGINDHTHFPEDLPVCPVLASVSAPLFLQHCCSISLMWDAPHYALNMFYYCCLIRS